MSSDARVNGYLTASIRKSLMVDLVKERAARTISDPTKQRSPKAIGDRLTALRKALAASQAEFCRQVGVATNTWNQYEAGRGRPALEIALLLKDRTHVTLDWIYTGDRSGLPHQLALLLAVNLN